MAKATKDNKPVTAKQSSVGKAGNLYNVIVAMDGHASSPAEFEAENPGPNEVYFEADEGADEVRMTWSLPVLTVNLYTFHLEFMKVKADNVVALQDDKKRVLILNYIHKKPTNVTVHIIPTKSDPNVEIYYHEKFKGTSFDICVYCPP